MRAFFGVIGKQLFLSLGQSRRAPAETEGHFLGGFLLSGVRGCTVDLRAPCLFALLSHFIWKPVFPFQPSAVTASDTEKTAIVTDSKFLRHERQGEGGAC